MDGLSPAPFADALYLARREVWGSTRSRYRLHSLSDIGSSISSGGSSSSSRLYISGHGHKINAVWDLAAMSTAQQRVGNRKSQRIDPRYSGMEVFNVQGLRLVLAMGLCR